MSVTLSPQVRIIALVGVALIALGGSAFFLMRGHASAQALPATSQPTPTTSTPVTRPTVYPLLPAPLRNALKRDAVVVVAFHNPHSSVAGHTIMEARAGAAMAHVGFLTVSLLNDSVAGRLTALLPSGQLLPNPGIVIYGRPGALLYRTDGYLPRAGVVEAVRGSR